MIKKLISLASMLSLTLVVSSTSFAASYSIIIEDLDPFGLDIGGFTFHLNVDPNFVSSNLVYGPAVPQISPFTWALDPLHNSQFGASDFSAVMGLPLTPLSNGPLLHFDYVGDIDPLNPYSLVKFTTTNAVDLYQTGDIVLKSFDDTVAIFGAPTTSAVPIPGAVWLLGSGLAGMVAMRRKKN